MKRSNARGLAQETGGQFYVVHGVGEVINNHLCYIIIWLFWLAEERVLSATDASNMNSPSISSGFVLPLTFAGPYNIENTCKNGQPSTPLTSVRNAQPTCMENWTRVVEDGGQVYRMVMIGCEDGSLYVFRTQDPPPSTPRDTASSIPPVVVQPPATKNASSPSGTPPPHHPSMAMGSQNSTFWKVSPRPRAVSGVNVEQAQAPKNYVDFDDEPDKLKDLLKGKNPMTKTQSDSSSEKTIPAIPVEEPAR